MAQKKIVTITQEVKEILYDIQNKAYLTGQAREAEGVKGYQAASNMQASADEESIYQIKRSIATAFAALKSNLGECLDESTTTSNNRISTTIESEGQLILAFSLPSNYNSASADSLGSSIHAYLVDMALADWFSITNKDDAATYISHSEVSLENAKRALYKRSRPTAPTYN